MHEKLRGQLSAALHAPILLSAMLVGCNGPPPAGVADGPPPEVAPRDLPRSEAVPLDAGRPDAAVPAPAVPAQLPSWAVVVPMQVGGIGEVRFMLDTGADVLRLGNALAKQAGGSTLASVSFGNTTKSGVPFSVYDTSQASGLLGLELDGIAGNTLFSDLVVALDYQKALVYPLATWRADYAFGGHVQTPFVQVPFKLGGPTHLIVAEGRFESQSAPTTVVLDTGTSSSVIS